MTTTTMTMTMMTKCSVLYALCSLACYPHAASSVKVDLTVYYDCTSVKRLMVENDTDAMIISHEEYRMMHQDTFLATHTNEYADMLIVANYSNVEGSTVSYFAGSCGKSQTCESRAGKLVDANHNIVKDNRTNMFTFMDTDELEYHGFPVYNMTKIEIVKQQQDHLSSYHEQRADEDDNDSGWMYSYATDAINWHADSYIFLDPSNTTLATLSIYGVLDNWGSIYYEINSLKLVTRPLMVDTLEDPGRFEKRKWNPNDIVVEYAPAFESANLFRNSTLKIPIYSGEIEIKQQLFGQFSIDYEVQDETFSMNYVTEFKTNVHVPAGHIFVFDGIDQPMGYDVHDQLRKDQTYIIASWMSPLVKCVVKNENYLSDVSRDMYWFQFELINDSAKSYNATIRLTSAHRSFYWVDILIETCADMSCFTKHPSHDHFDLKGTIENGQRVLVKLNVIMNPRQYSFV